MKKSDFNRGWIVKKTTSALSGTLFGKKNPPKETAVTLPHDAMIAEERNPANPSGTAGGFFPGGDYEYRKTFRVEESEAGQTFILEFEGVYHRGYIYVNGEFAGSTRGDYIGKMFDITPYLIFGADNMIMVKAVNSDVPNSRWYTGSGIFRPVWLYRGSNVRFGAGSLRVSTPEISSDVAAVRAEAELYYDLNCRKLLTLRTEIINAAGKCVSSNEQRITPNTGGSTKVGTRLYVSNPKLWSLETPCLYRCRVTILDGQEILDSDETTFGIRSLALDPVHGLRLNGKTVLLRGGCIHHDNGVVGAAAFARAEERRVELLKAAGFNSIRVSHNSSSVSLLDACDRIGMLVMEESYDSWTHNKSRFDVSLTFAEHYEEDLTEIVRKDFNHPSVFMYSIGNEIQNIGKPDGDKWNRILTEKLHELDATRYVTNAVNPLLLMMDRLPQVLLDFGMISEEQLSNMASGGGGINDMMTSLLGTMNDLAAHPIVERALSEVNGTLDLTGLNYARGAYGVSQQDPNRIYFGSETLPPDIDLNWKYVKEQPACIGDYTWTAWDYLGEAGIGLVEYNGVLQFAKNYPAYLAYCGDFDITGFRRPISYFREIVFGLRKEPYIAVQLPEHYNDKPLCTPWVTADCVSSWTWNGYEGKPCRVEVYSDAPEVELFVNGRSAGTLPCGENNRFKAVFDTVYEPGTISAVAKYEDETNREMILKTAGDIAVIDMSADRTELSGGDLSYVTIELKDKDGILHTSDARRISLQIEGPGVIQGFGSGDPYSTENFFDMTRTTWNGRLIAVVRAEDKTGPIRLTASADGLEDSFITIQAVK